jgi:predicted porin
MKKHLIAAAVAGALAVPAMAQVTVYGGLNTGIQFYNSDTAGKDSATGATNSMLYSSRIGFQGTEDLGGGLKASFRIEGGIAPSTGATTTMGSRESWVALSGGFGEVKLGKVDVSNTEGVDTLIGNGHFGNLTFVSGVELSGDPPNTVSYTAPKIGGATVRVGRSFGAAEGVSPTKPTSGTVTSISVSYSAGPLAAAVGYDLGEATTGDDPTYTTAGLRYDLGVVSVGYVYGKSEASTTGVERKVNVLSAKAPLGSGMALHYSYRDSKTGSAEKLDEHNVGISKALSKRTTVYAVYNDSDGNVALRSPTEKASRLSLQVLHTF